MKLHIELTRDEINALIPYQLICETMESSVWDTAKRKRLQKEWFTQNEIARLKGLKTAAHRWTLVTGIPEEGVRMSFGTLNLWKKLGLFCSQL